MSDILLRSLMFVPGHNEKLLESASRTDADVLLLDIEVRIHHIFAKVVIVKEIPFKCSAFGDDHDAE